MGILNKKTSVIFLILVLILSFCLASYFSFTQQLPILQTDGVSYYVDAKAYSQNLNLNEKIPAYNMYGAFETKVSDYPPLTFITLGVLLRVFGNDIFFVNGFYGALFFTFAAFFFYLFSKRIVKSEFLSILATLFFVLNIRAYIFLFSGVLTTFIAFCLSIPALYFTYIYFENISDDENFKRKNKNHVLLNSALLWCVIFSFLVSMTYFQIFFFVLLTQFFMALGFYIDKRLVFQFPKLLISIKLDFSKDVLKYLTILLLSSVFIITTVFLFVIRVGQRSEFVTGYVKSLLEPSVGLFLAWKNPFIIDGVIITTLFFFGIFYLSYKNRWSILAIAMPVLLYFIVPFLFFPKEVFLLNYIYRANVLMYPLMILVFIYVISVMWKNKDAKKIAFFLIIASLVIEIIKLGFFFSLVGPAISFEQRDASIKLSEFLEENKDADVLFLNNIDENGGFKSFKWILVYSKPDNFNIIPYLDNKPDIDVDYIFVSDKTKKYVQTENILDNFTLVFENGDSLIYERK